VDEHIHTGFIVFVTVGVYAVLFIQATRFVAAKLVQHPQTETIGKALGGVVHFG
jgi:hypothetical protein